MSGEPRPKLSRKTRLSKELEIDMHFNKNFDEKRSRRLAVKTTFDGQGRYRQNGLDACDCLDNNCPGCFFPCKKCSSVKCGSVCRRNRDDVILSWTTEGKRDAIRNSNISSNKSNGQNSNNKHN